MDYTPENTTNTTGQTMGTPPQGNIYPNPPQTPSPSEIYNSQATNAPQYHYGAPHNFFNSDYLAAQRAKTIERKRHENEIKSLGMGAGLTLLFLLGIAFVFSVLLIVPPFSTLYNTNLTFASAFGIFYSVCSVGGAFFIGSKILKKQSPTSIIPYNLPKDRQKTLLLILIGFGGCLVANYVTVFLRFLGEGIGVYSDYSAIQDPSSTLDIIMIFIGSAIIPPLIEEYALRGVLMQSLRKYGDAFAIVVSAFVFGIFHGNAVQIPFAFLCGLVIGYAVIATESLWTGIIIHALMNAMSGVSSALVYYFDEYISNNFFYIGSAVGIIFGILALVIYLIRYKFNEPFKASNVTCDLSLKEKFVNFNSSPFMIIAIILYVIQAVTQLSTTPPTY